MKTRAAIGIAALLFLSSRAEPAHAGVIARVSHIGYSYSIFRFDHVKGHLTWDPADGSKSTTSPRASTNGSSAA